MIDGTKAVTLKVQTLQTIPPVGMKTLVTHTKQGMLGEHRVRKKALWGTHAPKEIQSKCSHNLAPQNAPYQQ